MDIIRLSSLVAHAPGFLYKYTGDASEATDVSLHVTKELASIIGDSAVVTNVLDRGRNGIIAYSPVEISDSNFLLIGAVEPEPVVEETPAEETPAEETPEEGV